MRLYRIYTAKHFSCVALSSKLAQWPVFFFYLVISKMENQIMLYWFIICSYLNAVNKSYPQGLA